MLSNREISFAHNWFRRCPIILKLCTKHDSVTVVLCSKLRTRTGPLKLMLWWTRFEFKMSFRGPYIHEPPLDMAKWGAWVYFLHRHVLQYRETVSCAGHSAQGQSFSMWTLGPWFNIKMPSYQYRKSHCGDKTILRPSYLHNGISYTGKMTYLYWIRAQIL